MLNETTPNLIVRPRPPGSRRSSTKQDSPLALREKRISDQQDSNAVLLPSPSLTHSDTYSISSDAKHAMSFERDLDLDLPSDLTEALEKSMQRRPKRSISSSNKENVEPLSHTQAFNRAEKDVSDQYNQVQAEFDSEADKLVHSFESRAEKESKFQHRSTISIDSQNTGSDASIDDNWIGDLSREELEKLLFESRQIIKERERDLGIAAAIGKALLDKNISLRSRHEGIVSRFSSMNSMERIIVDQSNDINTPLPRYSPPHSDSANRSDDRNETDQRTPRPGEMSQSGSGYFQGMNASPSAKRMANTKRSESIIEELEERQLWNSSGNHFVPSRPASPHGTPFADSSLSSISASETHRRLELISQQNDDLLEQISQLHVESEDAKREGGKRQKRLIREIDGLRAELEAAQARTIELERNAEMQKKALETGHEQVKKQPWRRRGKMPWQSPGRKDKDAENDGRDSTENKGTNSHAEGSDLQNETGKEADALSLTGQSESSMSLSGKSRLQTDGERAIVSQLMAKVRELEEINVSLIKDAHERDGRIGRFLEDSERLRDMYDAVESEAVSNLSANPSMQDLTVIGHENSPISSAAPSPKARRRRAPGNRHLIENRRTVRAAMQNNYEMRSPKAPVDDYFDDSLNNSSVDSSPVKARPSRRMLRPRILITPSCEDLHARSENDRASGWEDFEHEGAKHFGQMTKSNSDPTVYEDQGYSPEQKQRKGLLHRASESHLGSVRNLQRSLGSELGSIYGDREVEYEDDDAPQQDGEEDGPSRRALYSFERNKGKAPRKAASQTSLRSMSEAGSDIADLKWSNGSSWTLRTEYDLPEIDNVPYKAIAPAPNQELAIVPTHQSLSKIAARPDGEWYSNVAQSLLPQGSLRNDVETSHDNYSLLEKLTKNVPVHWADDEDFGKPITEREAIKLGFLEGKNDRNRIGSGSQPARGMLSWIKPLRTKTRKAEDRPNRASIISSTRQIETAEDVERRRALERLLRAKRIAALHDRILAGQMSEEEARARGAFDSLDDDDEDDVGNQSGLANLSFETEVTQRALAYRTIRRRQMSNGILSEEPRMPRSGSSRSSLHDSLQPSPERRNVQSKDEKKLSSQDHTEEEESFEFVDLDPTKRRPGRRGTDYYPITLRERYKPEMVKQRMQNFSNETITWAMAWATFSIVMVFAFVAAFARGPKRILHGQAPQHQQP